MTGVELIAQERAEQISKHGYTADLDASYTYGELVDAAMFCLSRDGHPTRWNEEFKKKIASKSRVEVLTIAGALIAAEIDRLNNLAE